MSFQNIVSELFGVIAVSAITGESVMIPINCGDASAFARLSAKGQLADMEAFGGEMGKCQRRAPGFWSCQNTQVAGTP